MRHAVVTAAAADLYWWQVQRAHALRGCIVKTNGRLEFARIDIAVKNPGRIVELSVHEGEHATAGKILAKQDDAELNAQLAGARAQRAEALGAIAGETQTQGLYQKKLVSDVELQRRQLTLRSETAAVAAAAAELAQAKTSLEESDAAISPRSSASPRHARW